MFFFLVVSIVRIIYSSFSLPSVPPFLSFQVSTSPWPRRSWQCWRSPPGWR